MEPSPYLFSRQKRAFDLAMAYPLMAATYPFEKLTLRYLRSVLDEGDDYFIQDRDRATIIKLRTMLNQPRPECKDGQRLRHDARVPTFGARLIREARLDELPQIRQVVKGEFSIVSLRPMDAEFYDACLGHVGHVAFAGWEKLRKFPAIKPGLTSPAQVVNLSRQYEDADYCYAMIEADERLVRENSLAMDIDTVLHSAVGIGRLLHQKIMDYALAA